eukprot:scaffold19864_cov101-Isochrysis_galbana.AAC.4
MHESSLSSLARPHSRSSDPHRAREAGKRTSTLTAALARSSRALVLSIAGQLVFCVCGDIGVVEVAGVRWCMRA